jgi:hypothetical protein
MNTDGEQQLQEVVDTHKHNTNSWDTGVLVLPRAQRFLILYCY